MSVLMRLGRLFSNKANKELGESEFKRKRLNNGNLLVYNLEGLERLRLVNTGLVGLTAYFFGSCLM
jgi:hypothetical protein